MKKLIRPAALVLFASSLFAQSPFAGTWKLDPAKTKYKTGAPPKDLTLVIEEKGDTLQVTATGTNPDGSPLTLKYTAPEKGGTGKILDGTAYDGITSKRVSADVRDNSFTKNGKEVSARHVVVSKDGKILRSSVKGSNPLGNRIAGTDVLAKQ